MSSGKEPCAAATGATPRAIASTAARPKVSSQADGSTTARAAAIAAAHASGSSWPTTRTDGRVAAQALHLVLKRPRARDHEAQPGAAAGGQVAVPPGHQDRHALGRVQPARVDDLGPRDRRRDRTRRDHVVPDEHPVRGQPDPAQQVALRGRDAGVGRYQGPPGPAVRYRGQRDRRGGRARIPVAAVPDRADRQRRPRSRGIRPRRGRSPRWRRRACSCGWSRPPGPLRPGRRTGPRPTAAGRCCARAPRPVGATAAPRARSRRAPPFHTTAAGSAALRAAGHSSMSSLRRSNSSTSCPSPASAAVSWSTTRFSPLGAAERYRLCAITILMRRLPTAGGARSGSCQAPLGPVLLRARERRA